MSSNIVFDHISADWNQDEGIGVTTANNITFSYNIVAEPVGQAGKGTIPVGGSLVRSRRSTVTMTNIDFHHNLTMNNSHRNPLMRNRSSRLVNNLWYNLELIWPTCQRRRLG